MGQMMILYSQLDSLDGVDAEVDEEGIHVYGDLDAAREYLDEGWYTVEEQGVTPKGRPRGMVVSDTDDDNE
jgi:hypothetical protein